MVHICNGRYGDDRGIGHFTFAGVQGNSVIDYALCSHTIAHMVLLFKIDERTESSHFPVCIGLTCDNTQRASSADVTRHPDNRMGKYYINEKNMSQYKDNVASQFTNEYIQSLITKIDNSRITIDTIIDTLVNMLKTCAECCYRKRQIYTKSQPRWFDTKCKTLKAEKCRLLRLFRHERSNANLVAYKQGRSRFRTHCDIQKNLYHQNLLDDLVLNSDNPKSFWNKLKRMCNSRQQTLNDITKEQWVEHFEKLFKDRPNHENNTENIDDIEYDITEGELEDVVFNSEITDEEILKSVKSLKCGTSAGTDELIPEFFIKSIDNILPLINRLFNRIFDTADFPTSWCYSVIVTLYKKGDANIPDNYRGISLLNVFGKIYTSILTRRVTFYTNIYDKINESQAGFREGYSTIDNAFILYSLITKYLSKKRGKLYVAYVDLTKAFDLVNRNKLWKVVSNTGIKGKLYKNLLAMYKSVNSCIRTSDGLTDFFKCPFGLKQGCLASPILFSIFINEFANEVERSGLRGVQLFPDLIEILLLMFADDLALISDSVLGLQRLLNLLYSFCKTKDLIVNILKTKVSVYKNGGTLAKTEKWTYGGEKLEVVPCFTYLGLNFTRQLSLEQMANDQATKGKHVLVSILSKLYRYGQLTNNVFFKIFDTKVLPILMYGAEIWGIQARHEVERVQHYACKHYLCARQNSTNDAVMGDCGRYPLYVTMANRVIRYWIKITKMQDHRYVKK